MKSLFTLLLFIQISFSAEVIGFLTKYNNNSVYFPSASDQAILTQVNLFPFIPKSWGGIESSWTCKDVSNLNAVGLKVYMTIGGADYSDAFDDAAGSNLTTFVASIITQVNACEYDGVDIDWEFPDNPTRATKFKNLIAKLRTELPANVKISIDVPTQWLEAQIGAAPFEDNSTVFSDADYINVMNYDDFRTPTKPNHSGFIKSLNNMNYWLTKVGPEKLVLGVPFYGRPAESSNASAINYSNTGASNDTIDSYSWGGTIYYYNGPEMIYDKALYAKHSKFHGVMFWAMNTGSNSADKNSTNSNSLLYQINRGLNQPSRPGGTTGYNPFIEDETQSNEIIYQDGYYWKKNNNNYLNIEPYGVGNEQILSVWSMKSEPWCDTYYRWQFGCTYTDVRLLEVSGTCYELLPGLTSTLGVSPVTTEGQLEWEEKSCNGCEIINYGDEWNEYCVYRAGDVLSYNGFLWETKDLSSFGIDSIPMGTTPSVNNDVYWENVTAFNSSAENSSSSTTDLSSSSQSSIDLIYLQNGLSIDIKANSQGVQWNATGDVLGTISLLSPLGRQIEKAHVSQSSGDYQWSNTLVSGRYFVIYHMNESAQVIQLIVE